MRLIVKHRHDSIEIMVIREIIQSQSGRPASSHIIQTFHVMGDFKIIVIIMRRIQRFVQDKIGHRVEMFRIGPPDILSANDLSHQPEVRPDLVCLHSEFMHKAEIQYIRRVQPQSVDRKRIHPELHRLLVIANHLRIALVQFGQQIVSAPVFVAESVPVLIISGKIHISVPVPVPGRFTVFLQILKRKKLSARMIEYGIQNHPDSPAVALSDKKRQILIGSQPSVHFPVIRGLIPMSHRFKQRPDVQRAAPDFHHMIQPGNKRQQPILHRSSLILLRSPRQPQRVNMIKNSLFIPCHNSDFLPVCSDRRLPISFVSLIRSD